MQIQSYSLSSYSPSRMAQEVVKFSPLAPVIAPFASSIYGIKLKIKQSKEKKLFELLQYSPYANKSLIDLKVDQIRLLGEIGADRRRSSREDASIMMNLCQFKAKILDVLQGQITVIESLMEKQFSSLEGQIKFDDWDLEESNLPLGQFINISQADIEKLIRKIKICQCSLIKLHEEYKKSGLTFAEFSLSKQAEKRADKVKGKEASINNLQEIKKQITEITIVIQSHKRKIDDRQEKYEQRVKDEAELVTITKIINLKIEQTYHKHQARTWAISMGGPFSTPVLAYMNHRSSLKEKKFYAAVEEKVKESTSKKLEGLGKDALSIDLPKD